MNVGDIVIERDGPHSGHLRSGCETYLYGICVSVEPFVMVSPHGDMLWVCLNPAHFTTYRTATAEESKQAFDRYHRRGRWAPPPAPNELREYEVSA
jgi:hypothetical protein